MAAHIMQRGNREVLVGDAMVEHYKGLGYREVCESGDTPKQATARGGGKGKNTPAPDAPAGQTPKPEGE